MTDSGDVEAEAVQSSQVALLSLPDTNPEVYKAPVVSLFSVVEKWPGLGAKSVAATFQSSKPSFTNLLRLALEDKLAT